MFSKLDDKTFCLIIVVIFQTIFFCNSVNHSFCNDLNPISNIYSVGTYIYITQGMTTIWKYDTKTNRFSSDKQTLNSIFGEDRFEVVDSVFTLDLSACKGKGKECINIENARNLVLAIGEKIKSTDTSKPYGYIAYRLKPDNTLEEMNKNWAHNWGLTAEGTFSGTFWPSFRRNGSLIIGSAYSKNDKTLYLLVNEIDDKRNPLYRIYNRELNTNGVWGEWTAYASSKKSGMFSFRGSVYAVDSESNVKSLGTKKNGLIDKKKISSAKEFFNCFKNSTLLKYKDLPEERVNDFSESRLSPDLDPYPKWGETVETTPEPLVRPTTTASTTTTTSRTTTEQTVITTTDSEAPIPEVTTGEKESESSGQPTSGWLVLLLILLIIVLIFVIVLIAILLNIKNKNKDKAKPQKPLATPAKGATSAPKTTPKAGGGSNKTGTTTGAKPGSSSAKLKQDSIRSEIV